MATVSIVTPKKDMPSSFAVHGRASGKELRTLELTAMVDGKQLPPEKVRLLRLGRAPGGKAYEYLWVAAILKATKDAALPCKVTVQGLDRALAKIAGATDTTDEFKVAKPIGGGPPTITYPPGGHVIQDGECNDFMPFGGSELDITSVTLGGVPALFRYWDPGIEFWYAYFTGLGGAPGPGHRTLVATNDDGDTTCNVVIDGSCPT